MFDNGYRGFIRGIKGSTAEHLENLAWNNYMRVYFSYIIKFAHSLNFLIKYT